MTENPDHAPSSDLPLLVEVVRNAILAEFRRQIPLVYFWDPADKELFDPGEPELDEFQGGLYLADRFDMDAVARAAIKAMSQE